MFKIIIKKTLQSDNRPCEYTSKSIILKHRHCVHYFIFYLFNRINLYHYMYVMLKTSMSSKHQSSASSYFSPIARMKPKCPRESGTVLGVHFWFQFCGTSLDHCDHRLTSFMNVHVFFLIEFLFVKKIFWLFSKFTS